MPSSDAHGHADRARPLAVLRAMIDSVDRELLQQLARRNALVGEVALYKREHQVPIRDADREREIIDDRRERATPLGLSPELTESLFRLILWGSRDRQAALKAEVPPDMEARTVAVIGGRGAMGRCIAQLFGDLGHNVLIADCDTQLTPEESASVADVVVISVPIATTVEVIRTVGPSLRRSALLMDVTSIKTAPVKAMLEACDASVVGTHPLFSPSVHSLQGQRVVLTRGRGEEWFEWVRRMLGARGLYCVEATPEAHDKAMAIVQVLTHFATEVMGRTLATLDVSIEETLRFTSPIYLMELLMTARHFAQSPELYAAIEMSNPATSEVMSAFVQSAKQVEQIVANKDGHAFEDMFDEVRQFFGPFTDRALEQSSFLIDRLVERT